MAQQAWRHSASPALTRARIRVPTLILWGEQDSALQVDLAEASLQWVDAGRLVRFAEATHWLHEDKPAEVTRLLAEHFGED